MTVDLDELGARAVAETPTCAPLATEIRSRAEARRRRTRRRVAVVMVAVAALLVVGGVSLVERQDPDQEARTSEQPLEQPPGTLPVTSTAPGPELGECSTTAATEPDKIEVEANFGALSLAEMARTVWPTISGDIPIVDLTPSTDACSVTVETPSGGFTVAGYEGPDALWYLSYVSPIENDPDAGLSVTWLTDGTVKVYSDQSCEECVSSEVTAIASSGDWVTTSGIPVAAELFAPRSDTGRAVLIRWFDAAGAVRRVFLTPIGGGDFAAG